MSVAQLEALDEAWFETFGELLILPASEPGQPLQDRMCQRSLSQPIRQLSTREVLRITGFSLSTLKRRVLDKWFPEPLRISTRRISWPASDVKRCLDDLDVNRHRNG